MDEPTPQPLLVHLHRSLLPTALPPMSCALTLLSQSARNTSLPTAPSTKWSNANLFYANKDLRLLLVWKFVSIKRI